MAKGKGLRNKLDKMRWYKKKWLNLPEKSGKKAM
jgi:hypothetical protein